MTLYAVGDLQGNLDPLRYLLDHVGFSPTSDQLWVAGDLVNRGPQSLETLRFLYDLGSCVKPVLGNHDLHLIACAVGARTPHKNDTLDAVLAAPDCMRLIEWLLHTPLIHTEHGFTLVHAGILPSWSLTQAHRYAQEVHTWLKNPANIRAKSVASLFGDKPAIWSNTLKDNNRLRFIVNAFTRMRYCNCHGHLDFTCTAAPDQRRSKLIPWFAHPLRQTQQQPIIFGHWAALNGVTQHPNTFALDTGYVWGNRLTLLQLDTLKRFECLASKLTC